MSTVDVSKMPDNLLVRDVAEWSPLVVDPAPDYWNAPGLWVRAQGCRLHRAALMRWLTRHGLLTSDGWPLPGVLIAMSVEREKRA